MDRPSGKRIQTGAIRTLVIPAVLFGLLVSNGQALSTSLLVDADQAPSPHQGDKTPLSASTGCARLVGCASATGNPPSSLQSDEAKNKSAAASPAPPPPQSQPSAPNQTEGVKINKPSKKSHSGDQALVQPASQYHYYGGNTEERRRRNVRFYPAPMKRKYADYSRLKRNVRLSPKDMLALLALWERPLTIDDSAPALPTQSSHRRYFKHQDMDRELMLDDDDEDDDDDENEYGIERSRDPWSDGRESGGRYFPQDPYRTEKRSWQRQRALEEQQLEARKRFERLVQKQIDELRREREQPRGRYESANPAGAEWGGYMDYKPEYKRRSSLGTARYKPEEVKLYRWLQNQRWLVLHVSGWMQTGFE